MRRLLFGILVSAVMPLLTGLMAAEPLSPPGIVIAHSPAPSRKYLGSPSLTVLSNGVYLASHDFFGPGTTFNETHIYQSKDRGSTWLEIAILDGQFWSSLFTLNDSAYILGTSAENGLLIIRRSMDGGFHWSKPLSANTGLLRGDGKFHCAPVPVIFHHGRIWRAFEQVTGDAGWGRHFRAFMMSAPVGSDLLNATNWTSSNALGYQPNYLDGNFGGWLEGNAVVTPAGGIVDILRVDYRKGPEKAAVIQLDPDGKTVRFDSANGFMDFPGGCKKFVIRFDPETKSYWALSNYVPPQFQNANPERTRNTLALLHSSDLHAWEIRCVLLHHPDRERHAFQYPDWLFDGPDMIAVIRTAWDDDTGGAHNQHDANFITFHRFKNFRQLAPKDSLLPLVP